MYSPRRVSGKESYSSQDIGILSPSCNSVRMVTFTVPSSDRSDEVTVCRCRDIICQLPIACRQLLMAIC
jgi:hypothetical protein